jgi:hypothetical protein
MLMIDTDYFIYNLIDVTIMCNAGHAYDIAKRSMDAGASGATIGYLKQYFSEECKPEKMSSAREACTICIPDSKLDEVIGVLEEHGAFDESVSSELLIRKSPKAYTYA